MLALLRFFFLLAQLKICAILIGRNMHVSCVSINTDVIDFCLQNIHLLWV